MLLSRERVRARAHTFTGLTNTLGTATITVSRYFSRQRSRTGAVGTLDKQRTPMLTRRLKRLFNASTFTLVSRLAGRPTVSTTGLRASRHTTNTMLSNIFRRIRRHPNRRALVNRSRTFLHLILRVVSRLSTFRLHSTRHLVRSVRRRRHGRTKRRLVDLELNPNRLRRAIHRIRHPARLTFGLLRRQHITARLLAIRIRRNRSHQV